MLGAVIFDMDGVIIDSEPIHFEAYKETLKEFGVEADTSGFSCYVGVSNIEMWEDLKRKYNLKISTKKAIERQMEITFKVFNEMTDDAIPGIRELLNELKAKGVLIALASSSPVAFIEEVLKKLEIRKYFDVVQSGEEVEMGKPAPDIFLKAAKLLEVTPEECVVIEDAEHGANAAKAAGMKCIGYINPNSGQQDLSCATCTVDNMKEITYDFIKNLF